MKGSFLPLKRDCFSRLIFSWKQHLPCSPAGGLVFECLAALKADELKSDCAGMKRIVEQIKEEEEEEAEEGHGGHDEVFCLELERDKQGLGLALVDTRVSDTSSSSMW